MAKVFTAQWGGGYCPECDDPIEKGDDVSYLPTGELLHAECNDLSDHDEWFDEDYEDN